jgi:hypothetical protein
MINNLYFQLFVRKFRKDFKNYDFWIKKQSIVALTKCSLYNLFGSVVNIAFQNTFHLDIDPQLG